MGELSDVEREILNLEYEVMVIKSEIAALEKQVPRCDKCNHAYSQHETLIELSGGRTVRECNAYMGMGDWCGCEEPDVTGTN